MLSQQNIFRLPSTKSKLYIIRVALNTGFDTACLSGWHTHMTHFGVYHLVVPFSIWPGQGFYVDLFSLMHFTLSSNQNRKGHFPNLSSEKKYRLMHNSETSSAVKYVHSLCILRLARDGQSCP